MKKIVIATLSFMIMSFAFAQPGKLRGPGGQYSERMEMMMIWKLTDHLELSEEQAEKFFPSMRLHQKQVLEIRKEERELFSPTFAKVKKGDQISKSEVTKLLKKIENPFHATRYHSLIIEKRTLPSCFDIAAETDNSLIMAITHKTQRVYGLQFHPESIATDHGHKILKNFLQIIN